jgi:hypothetical protein
VSGLRTILALVVFALGCEASTSEPARPPRALAVPDWVEPAGPSAPVSVVPDGRGSVLLQGDPGAQVGGSQPHYTSSSAPSEPRRGPPPAATSTFFPPEYNARMFGGCAANDYTGGKCPDPNH